MDIPADDFENEFTQAFGTETLRGDRVTLVGLRDSSAEDYPMSSSAVFRLVQGSKMFLAKHLPWVLETSQQDIAKRIRSWVFAEQYGQGGCWGIFEGIGPAERRLAGFIMLEANLRNRSANISYWLGQMFTGRGIATEALRVLCGYSFDVLHLNRLEISVSVHNEKSGAVALRCGFQEEGISREFERINGAFVDHRRFSLLAKDFKMVTKVNENLK